MDVRLIRHPAAATAARTAALIAALGVKLVACVPDPDCAQALDSETEAVAALVCQREYARLHDPETGARLAGVLRRTGNPDGARAIAGELLLTPAAADGLAVLAKIAMDENRGGQARALLDRARSLHAAQHRPGKLAADDQLLSRIFESQGNLVDALRALDTCIAEAREGRDPVIEGYCHMSAGTILSEIGYLDGASLELDRAASLLVLDKDLAQLALERTNVHQLRGRRPGHESANAQAVFEATRALAYARRAGRTGLAGAIEMNLVYSYAALGQLDEATAHLERARDLDPRNDDAVERAFLQARIAYRRGDHGLTSSIIERVYDQLDSDEDRIDACAMEGRMALAAQHLDRAIDWANKGVHLVENLRSGQSAIEPRSWVLASRRDVYEILFTALARAGDVPAALVAFDGWQGRSLLDAMSRGRTAAPDGIRDSALQTELLQRMFPVLSSAPIMQPASPAALLAALAQVDLVALVVAESEVWRITSRHGEPSIAHLAPLATLQVDITNFQSQPTNRAYGEKLGVRLLGEDAFRSTDRTLHVLLDSPLSGLPVAALRRGGAPLIASRPIVRAARLSALECVPAEAPRHAVVIANASGDLDEAEREADEVARRFGVEPHARAAATRRALFSAASTDLLHVAVHSSVDLGGGTLALYDDRVSAIEIGKQHAGPKLVVLSSCESAASADGELATSLAMAFLASGSSQVIATLRQVNDAGAQQITSAFYQANGAAEPARALALVQAQLAETGNTDWPNFVMFGHDACHGTSR